MHLFLGHCGLILQLAPSNWVNFGGSLPLNGGGSGGKRWGTIDLIEVYWPAFKAFKVLGLSICISRTTGARAVKFLR